MNAQTNQVAKSSISVGLLNLEAFELSQRVANMLSHSTLVPEQYRAVTKVKAGKDNNGNWQYREEPNPSGLSNCIIALNIANRLGADELMVMQNLYIIEGRPAWSSQFIMAAINSCGRFTSLRFELKDLGEKEVEYQETQWNNGRKNIVTKKVKIQNMSCYAWVEEKGSVDENGKPIILKSSTISVEMAVKEGWYQKNGSKWQTMPEQMLRYRAASFFGRVYAPELLMGLRSAEEEQDMIDVTPEPVAKNTAGQVRALKQKILAAKNTSELYALGGELAELSETDKSEIQKIFTAQLEKLAGETVEAKEVVEKKQTATVEKKVNSTDLRKDYLIKMNKAESVDALDAIHQEFIANKDLTPAHLSYLESAYSDTRAKLQPQESSATQVDSIKSNSAKAGLLQMISDTQDAVALEAEVARAIKGNESKLTNADRQEVLTAYAHRKEVLSQQDIFETGPSIVDLTIQKIKQAKSQDEINAIFTDPDLEQLSEDDTAIINQAADMRESELQG
ncbi:recombinase RecT [Acinetobacter haemolyticus]|uniref:recombinase RecT n=1 Tax=Acinetobacter haemolyticus TaxID=29430 RepID=UPI0013737ECC|nr:recombinase RecT [Acinetobacter haemolyticus]NAR50321.1 recombinase RecT [Acinetobacter haemolyticus]